jgi:ABC-type branched-subunit amino acid transport system substrate-binding protein
MRGRRAHLRSSPPRRAGAARWAGWLAAVLAAGLAGACGNAGGAASATPIKIGFVLPLSGTVAANGQDERDGWNLGLKDAGGVIDGHRIQTMFADGAADPTTALTVTHQLVENRGAQLRSRPTSGWRSAATSPPGASPPSTCRPARTSWRPRRRPPT